MSDEGPGYVLPAGVGASWAELPGPLRWRTVRFLRARLPLDDQDALRREVANGWPPGSWPKRYPGWGTQLCELLRAEVDDTVEWHEVWTAAVAEAVGRPMA